MIKEGREREDKKEIVKKGKLRFKVGQPTLVKKLTFNYYHLIQDNVNLRHFPLM